MQIKFKVFDTVELRLTSLINEVLLLVFADSLFLFTDHYSEYLDEDGKYSDGTSYYNIGWVLLGCIGFVVLINLAVAAVEMIRIIRLHYIRTRLILLRWRSRKQTLKLSQSI